MLGLIEKDLRLTFIRKQTLFIFFIIAPIMGLMMYGPFVIGYLTMLAVMVSIGTISYDEFDNGFVFLMTLPFDRKTYVREKYLFSLTMAASGWCFGTVLYYIGNMIRYNTLPLIDELPMLLAYIPALSLSAAIMIPIQLKYGSEKSRIILYIIFGFIAIAIFGAKSFSGGANVSFPEVFKFIGSLSPVLLLLILTTVCILVMYVSYLWSKRIMDKKEF